MPLETEMQMETVMGFSGELCSQCETVASEDHAMGVHFDMKTVNLSDH